jgi:hypothetical protein
VLSEVINVRPSWLFQTQFFWYAFDKDKHQIQKF